MREITVPTLTIGYDYNAPLRWEHDGARGVEVSEIPQSGRVFFFDGNGPVARFDFVREARWWVKLVEFKRLGLTLPIRITRLQATHEDEPGDGYFFIIPNPTQPIVIHCTRTGAHDGCGPIECPVVELAVAKWIVDPIVAAAKGN